MPGRCSWWRPSKVALSSTRILSGVVARTAQVRVPGMGMERVGLGERFFVEAVAEHLLDRAIGERAERDGPTGGCLHPLGAIAVGQANDAEHRAVALLGMGPALQDRLGELGRGRPGVLGP